MNKERHLSLHQPVVMLEKVQDDSGFVLPSIQQGVEISVLAEE